MSKDRKRRKSLDNTAVSRLLHERFDDMKKRIVVPERFEDEVLIAEFSNGPEPGNDPERGNEPAPIAQVSDDCCRPKEAIWRFAEIACAALLLAGCVFAFTVHSPGDLALHRSVEANVVKQRIEGALDSVSTILQMSFPKEEKK